MQQTVNSIIEDIAGKYPLCEYAFGEVVNVPFSSHVREICKTGCGRYGKCWACPPSCGEIETLIKKCRQYEHFFLFSTVTAVEDAWNAEACLRMKTDHEAITRNIRRELQKYLPDCLVLSTGCDLCERCACPDEPCRHPEERLSSLESHGIVLMLLAESVGMSCSFGSDTVIFFSIVFY